MTIDYEWLRECPQCLDDDDHYRAVGMCKWCGRDRDRAPGEARHSEKILRCDRCAAAAEVQVNTPSGELLFCGHHYRRYAPALVGRGYELVGQVS